MELGEILVCRPSDSSLTGHAVTHLTTCDACHLSGAAAGLAVSVTGTRRSVLIKHAKTGSSHYWLSLVEGTVDSEVACQLLGSP